MTGLCGEDPVRIFNRVFMRTKSRSWRQAVHPADKPRISNLIDSDAKYNGIFTYPLPPIPPQMGPAPNGVAPAWNC